MKYFKASTKRGQNIIEMGERCYYTSLNELYFNWSKAKQTAFDWCFEQYAKSIDSSRFRIGNANSFGFTASWLCTINRENVLRVETKDNSYCVFLDR